MEPDVAMTRRDVLKAMIALGASVTMGGCSKGSRLDRLTNVGVPNSIGEGPADMRTWARYPEKIDLIMLADRPPLLETPLRYFLQDLTPNDAYFVRWHYAGVPTYVDIRSFRLNIIGAVEKPVQLSFNDLVTEFEPVSHVAFSQCSGNSRSFFNPQVPGAQWQNGAMGNARYKGARLKDVLKLAAV